METEEYFEEIRRALDNLSDNIQGIKDKGASVEYLDGYMKGATDVLNMWREWNVKMKVAMDKAIGEVKGA